MSTTALRSVLAEARAAQAEVAQAYNQLVRDLAGDREVPAAEVVETVELAGKTLDDLAADVERLAGRVAARAALDSLPTAEKDRDRAERERSAVENERAAALDKLKRQHEAAVARMNAEYDERTQPIVIAISEAQDRVSEAQAARTHLEESAPAELRERLADLRAAHERATVAAVQHARGLGARLATIDGLLVGGIPPERDESVRPYGGTPHEIRRARQEEQHAREVRVKQVAALERERAELLRDIERLEGEPSRLAGEIAAVRAEMLTV